MQIIDSHQHFWKYNPVRDSWIGDDMAVIKKDFLPQDLRIVMEQNKVDGCIIVQSDQSEEENMFQLNNAATYKFIRGIVGWVDLQATDIEERLNFYSGFKLMKGFRHVLQGEPERDLMLHPNFKRGIGLLQRYHFTFDLLIFADQLTYATKLAQQFADQKFVLDHIAKPNIQQQEIESWKNGIEALARCPNVYCKLSGLVTEANWHHWTEEDLDLTLIQ